MFVLHVCSLRRPSQGVVKFTRGGGGGGQLPNVPVFANKSLQTYLNSSCE